MTSGIQYFDKAIELEPLYAPAYAGLADGYSLSANYLAMAPQEAFPRAEAATRKALEFDPTLAEAHASLAFVRHHFDWDWAGAEAEYKRAIELAPGYALAHLRYAELLSNAGRHDEALREIFRARDLDPLSTTIEGNVGRILVYARRYDEAIGMLQKTVVLHPERAYLHVHLGMAYEAKRMFPQAIAEFKAAEQLLGGESVGLAQCYAAAGQPLEARRILAHVEKPAVVQPWFFIGGVYAALGEKDRAFFWLDKAYQNRDFFMTYLNVYPGLDPLRSDPRFADLARRVGQH
jgi:tetratricopeptide (TPR) repeat protein